MKRLQRYPVLLTIIVNDFRECMGNLLPESANGQRTWRDFLSCRKMIIFAKVFQRSAEDIEYMLFAFCLC